MYTLMLFLAALNAAVGGSDSLPHGRLVWLLAAWVLSLYAPKLLGYAEVMLSARSRARYGGGALFLAGAALEMVFALVLAAPMTWSAAVGVVRALVGYPAKWPAQNRTARPVGWREAAGLLWPHTLYGLVVFGLLASCSWLAVAWALPFAGGLLIAIPFCVATADPDVSRWLRRRRIAATPEELQPWSRAHSSGSDAASAYQRETSRVPRTASQ
jgi:membrane glycosyltransferase